MTKNLNKAIHACKLDIKKSDFNSLSLIKLINLYMTKGDYKAAITTEMQLLKIKSVNLLLTLKNYKDFLITPSSLENKLKSSLER